MIANAPVRQMPNPQYTLGSMTKGSISIVTVMI